MDDLHVYTPIFVPDPEIAQVMESARRFGRVRDHGFRWIMETQEGTIYVDRSTDLDLGGYRRRERRWIRSIVGPEPSKVIVTHRADTYLVAREIADEVMRAGKGVVADDFDADGELRSFDGRRLRTRPESLFARLWFRLRETRVRY